MAYIIQSLKRISFKKLENKKNKINSNKIFIFIVVLCAIVIAVDYALVIKFISMIENI